MMAPVLIGILLFFYGTVAYVAVHPAVSKEYVAYYIEQVSDLPPGKPLEWAPLTLGKAEPHSSRNLIFQSWQNGEATHRWTSGTHARISFLLDEASLAAAKGVIVLDVFPAGRQDVSFRLNGRPLTKKTLTGDSVVEIRFDPKLLHKENTLAIEVPHARTAGGNDTRVIGLAMRSLRLE